VVGDVTPGSVEGNPTVVSRDFALVDDGPLGAGIAGDPTGANGRRRIDVCPGIENGRVLGRHQGKRRGLNRIDGGLRVSSVGHANANRHDHRGDRKRKACRATQQAQPE